MPKGKKKEKNLGKIEVELNCGRWIATCPVCGMAGNVYPHKKNEKFICGNCVPGKHATAFKRQPGGLYRKVFDRETINAVLDQEIRAGQYYELVWPSAETMREIDEALRPRKIEHYSWVPGETAEDLERENRSHRRLKYLEQHKDHKAWIERQERQASKRAKAG